MRLILGLAIVRSIVALSQGSLSKEPVTAETFKYDLMDFPDPTRYLGPTSHQTDFLLSEAEKMLNRVKVVKERIGLQTFIIKMKKLAATVKQNIREKVNSKVEYDQSEGSKRKNSSVEESTPQKFVTTFRSVEESPATIAPEILAYHSTFPEEQTIVKNQGLEYMADQDELVRELEDLHRVAKNGEKSVHLLGVYEADNDIEKRNIEMEQGKKILVLKKLGFSPYEIELALGLAEPKMPMALKPIHLFIDRLKMRTHGYNIRNDSSAKKTMTYQRNLWKTKNKLSTTTNTSLSKAKHVNMLPVKGHMDKLQIEQLAHHINLPLTFPPSIPNMLRNLRRENDLFKKRLYAIRNLNNVKGVLGSSPINEHSNVYHPDLFMGARPSIYTTNIYNPNQKNFMQRNMYGLTSNVDFSDEMKKELINGKVILLSHSVVPSNFDPETKKKY